MLYAAVAFSLVVVVVAVNLHLDICGLLLFAYFVVVAFVAYSSAAALLPDLVAVNTL